MVMNIRCLTSVLAAGLVLFSFLSSPARASVDQHALLMLKTAKEIEFVSQKVAKAYFYRHLDIRADQADQEIQEGLALLQQGIRDLKASSLDNEAQNVATFLTSTIDELAQTLKKTYNRETGALMIDYSESLMEGAKLLSQRHIIGRSPEEAMLVETEHLLFLLERMNKYYIAHKAGFKNYNNVVQLEQAVKDFEASLASVNGYRGYSQEARQSVENINQFWPIAKEFYLGEKGALPVIVLASTDRLEKEVRTLGAYHQTAAARGM
jgi:hypothetical protein